jgi:hypothetical protein
LKFDGGKHWEGFELTWWTAVLAVGLNFASKKALPRARSLAETARQRKVALLYAAYGLEQLLILLKRRNLSGPVQHITWPTDEDVAEGGSRFLAHPRSGIDSSLHTASPAIPTPATAASRTSLVAALLGSKSTFLDGYRTLMSRIASINLKILVWYPSSEIPGPVVHTAQILRLALEDRGYVVQVLAEAQSKMPSPSNAEHFEALLTTADCTVVLADDSPGVVEQVSLMCVPAVALGLPSRILALLPRSFKAHSKDALSELDEHFEGVYWYAPEELTSGALIAKAEDYVEARRVLRAWKGGST